MAANSTLPPDNADEMAIILHPLLATKDSASEECDDSRRQAGLDCLPDELILLVVEHAKSAKDIASLAASCRRLRDLLLSYWLDSVVWRPLCLSDFPVPPALDPHPQTWRTLYAKFHQILLELAFPHRRRNSAGAGAPRFPVQISISV